MGRSITLLILGASLSVPALAWRGDVQQALRERLSRTSEALSDLAGIEARVAARDPAAVVEILSACEAGPGDAARAELELAALRSEIQVLQARWDGVGWPEPLDGRAPGFLDRASAASTSASASEPSAEISAGASPAAIAATAKMQFEPEGFVADRARLGRACWRGGRYQEGVSALEPLAGDPQADYWRARCLEKLARHAEALALYGKLIEIAGDSPEGRSAREDRDFLQWSLDHGLVKSR